MLPGKPAVICILGKKKSGKTRLLEGLIRELKKRNLKVGALKHHRHDDFDIDIEGKDTWKYARAGADTVAISSPTKLAVIKKSEKDTDVDELCRMYFTGLDLVLAEGYALSDKPRIIIAGSQEDIEIFGRGCDIITVVKTEDMETKDRLMIDIAERIIDYFNISPEMRN